MIDSSGEDPDSTREITTEIREVRQSLRVQNIIFLLLEKMYLLLFYDL